MVNIEMIHNTLIHTANRTITTARGVDLKVTIATESYAREKFETFHGLLIANNPDEMWKKK